MRKLHILIWALMPALASAQGCEGASPPETEIRVAGRLTDEGVECQAMRAGDGTLYTLLGELGDLEAGDEVEVQGTLVEFSFCMQGQTLQVHAITGRGR
jgi:hypothetical protein